MKSPKGPRKTFPPTTTDLRGKDPSVLRAEIAVFVRRISEKTAREPGKAAVVLADWLNRAPAAKKKAA